MMSSPLLMAVRKPSLSILFVKRASETSLLVHPPDLKSQSKTGLLILSFKGTFLIGLLLTICCLGIVWEKSQIVLNHLYLLSTPVHCSQSVQSPQGSDTPAGERLHSQGIAICPPDGESHEPLDPRRVQLSNNSLPLEILH